MNRKETAEILSSVRAAYPGAYRESEKDDINAAISLWNTMFENEPYELVSAALTVHIATSKWPPTIADMREKIAELTGRGVLSETEAWKLVTKAISNGIYESRKEYERLPEEVRQAVGSHNMIHDWALMNISEVQTIVRSNFLKSYRAVAEERKRYDMLPAGALGAFPKPQERRELCAEEGRE